MMRAMGTSSQQPGHWKEKRLTGLQAIGTPGPIQSSIRSSCAKVSRRPAQPIRLAQDRLSLGGKSLTAALLAGLVLAACTQTAGLPQPDRLTTSVQATLTALPGLSADGLPTPPPSATPIPSITPTHTPAPADTPTPAPTAIPADDPRFGLDLGSPHYVDNFAIPHTWFQDYSDNRVAIFLVEGSLQCTDKLTDHIITWSTSAMRETDVLVEITADIADCEGKDGYGLGLRIGGTQYDRGYTLEFSCDGQYRIRKFIDVSTAPVTLIDWTPSAAISTGSNASNRLGFAAKGASLYALANGQLIGQVQDASYSYGTFGLFASAAETAGVTVSFDYFALWRLAP